MAQTRPATPSRHAEPDRQGRPSLGLFYRQVIAELRKVVWPTREQLLTYTAVVLVFVAVIIAIVSVLDLAFGWLVFRIFG